MLWDESADELVLAGDTKLSFHDAAGGENIIASADGHLEINAGTTLDITATTIDFNGAVVMDSNVRIGAGPALATNATTGFLYIPSMAGTPSGTPTDYTALSAIVHDTSNHKLYLYDHVNGAWKYAALS